MFVNILRKEWDVLCLCGPVWWWRPCSSDSACPLWNDVLSVEVLFTSLFCFGASQEIASCMRYEVWWWTEAEKAETLRWGSSLESGWWPKPMWAVSPGCAEGKGSAVSQTHVLPCKKKERRKKERSWGNSDQKTSTIWENVDPFSLLVGHLGPLSQHLVGLWSPSFREGSLRCTPFLSEIPFTPYYG